jgi:hypothetical protein
VEKVIDVREEWCLFCGEKRRKKWDDYTEVLEDCECPEAEENRRVSRKISAYKSKIVQPKFRVIQQLVMTDKEENPEASVEDIDSRCLFCGQVIEGESCDCEDVRHNLRIQIQIAALLHEKPVPRYHVVSRRVLKNI